MSLKLSKLKSTTLSRAFYTKNKLKDYSVPSFLIEKDEESGEIFIHVKSEDLERANKLIQNHDFFEQFEEQTEKKRSDIILLIVDLSNNSFASFQFAFMLAKKCKAEIKLLHVSKKSDQNIQNLNKKLLDNVSAERLDTVLYYSSFINGNAEEEITEIASKYKPMCTILETHTNVRNSINLTGNIKHDYVRKSDIPIIVIPKGFVFKEADFIKILYATDFNNSDYSSIDQLMQIVKLLKPKIYFVHIETKNNLSVNKIKMDELKKYALSKKYDNTRYYLIENENFIEALNIFIKKNQINALSLTSPKRSIFNRIFETDNLKILLSELNVPLLVFRS